MEHDTAVLEYEKVVLAADRSETTHPRDLPATPPMRPKAVHLVVKRVIDSYVGTRLLVYTLQTGQCAC
jgi:hypothetical protein